MVKESRRCFTCTIVLTVGESNKRKNLETKGNEREKERFKGKASWVRGATSVFDAHGGVLPP
jgi:hypothetical protein